MAITTVWSESSWAFPESHAADNSERSSNGGLAQEAHLGNANGYAAVVLQEMQGLSTSSGSNAASISHDKTTHLLFMLCAAQILE